MDEMAKFPKNGANDFLREVRRRVHQTLEDQGVPIYANLEMKLKTALIFTGIFLCTWMIYFGVLSPAQVIGWYALMGFFKSLHGLNIAHDAAHDCYFRSRGLNKCLAFFFDFFGTSSYIWRISHNQYHHIYTNIPKLDHDIDKGPLVRFSPADPIRRFHSFQHLYSFILYAFSTINWVFVSDYVWFWKLMKKKEVPKSEIFFFWLFKALNILVFFAIPMAILNVPWWTVPVGLFALHLVSGMTSAIVFQMAHLVEGVAFVERDEEGGLPYDWATHEMLTTSNFSTKSRIVTFFTGGLNFQIEHHLFPHVCHSHYFWISPIVKQTAEEYGMPYHELPTFRAAIASHYRTLKKLGAP